MTGRVLVYDPYQDVEWAQALSTAITAESEDVEVAIPWDPDEADAELALADVVVVTGRRMIGADQIQTMTRTVGIVCFSVGMDQVDVVAAAAAGIRVLNVPDYCTEEVADHAMALLLAAVRNLIPVAAWAQAGRWGADTSNIHRLRGQTVGILGAGRIGQAVAARARAFGLAVIAHDSAAALPAGTTIELVGIEQLAHRSDIVVICAALTPESAGLLDGTFFAMAKPGMVLVNVSRGGLVDEAALLAALDSGTVVTAALDVRATEPPDPSTDLLAGRPDVILTPHVAGSSVEAFDELLRKAAVRVCELLRTPDGRPARAEVLS